MLKSELETKLEVGNFVLNIETRTALEIVEVQRWWGTYTVLQESGLPKVFNISGLNSGKRLLTPQERADYFLKMENSGITDYWRDY